MRKMTKYFLIIIERIYIHETYNGIKNIFIGAKSSNNVRENI
jgi:hypothetical protein